MRPLLLTMGIMALMIAPAQAQPSLETAVKAAYLYKLAPFVEWPAGDPARPFTICVVGPDPFGAVLDRAVAGQAYNGRPFTVVRMATLDAPDGCNIAYAGGSPQQIAATLQASQGHAVLTVTDNSPSAGMVDFIVQQGKVRFRIDQAAAADSGLAISSRLLSLALAVNSSKARP